MRRAVTAVLLVLGCGGDPPGPTDPGTIYQIVSYGASCGAGGLCTVIAEARTSGGTPVAGAWTGYTETGTTYAGVDERTADTGQFVVEAFSNDPGDSVWVCAAERRGCNGRADGLLVMATD